MTFAQTFICFPYKFGLYFEIFSRAVYGKPIFEVGSGQIILFLSGKQIKSAYPKDLHNHLPQ